MKRNCGAYGAGIMLAMIVSCSREAPDQPTTQIPPAPPASALAPADGYEVSAVTNGGSVGGTITFSSAGPRLPVRKISKDIQVCGTADRESQKLIVNKTGGLKNAVVIVEDLHEQALKVKDENLAPIQHGAILWLLGVKSVSHWWIIPA